MDVKEFEALLADVEVRLERLRALYDQWFQGFERIEPTVPRKEVERRFQILRKSQPRNTALRFRFNTTWQRYVTLQTYWKRVARQIEEGTYRRDLLKARNRREAMRRNRRDERAPGSYEIDVDTDLSQLDTDAEIEAALAGLEAPGSSGEAAPQPRASLRPSLSPFARRSVGPTSPGTQGVAGSPVVNRDGPVTATFGKPQAAAPKAAAAPKPEAAPQRQGRPPTVPQRSARSGAGGDIDDARLKRLYQDYVDARRRNNERTDNVRYESVAKSVRQMLPKLREKHKGKAIDFQVVVKDGKVGIKPIPKK